MEASRTSGKIRIAILQRVCPNYRVSLFAALSATETIDFRLFIGEDLPNSKVKNAGALYGVNVTRLKTRFVRVGRRILPWHIGLTRELKNFAPDVILCEGESHFFGYLQAIYYRVRYDNSVALMHWCFISLPGERRVRRDVAARIKGYFRKYFDAFVVYSSFSRERLIELGEECHKVFVATNVGNVEEFLMFSDSFKVTKSEARRILGLRDRFTILYAGTLDEGKRPSMILDLAGACDKEEYDFVLAGSGALLHELRQRAESENLTNVFLLGRVTDDLHLCFRAADVLLVPGRGGIVISEAMAAGLPVIVHQADGTEYDLVVPGITGYRLKECGIQNFVVAMESLRREPHAAARMGKNARKLVEQTFNQANMVRQVIQASHYARASRGQRAKSKG